MYGIKTTVNGIEDIKWVDSSEMAVRLSAALAVKATLNNLSKFEDGFDVVEESTNKYVAKGRRTGFVFGVEVVKVGA